MSKPREFYLNPKGTWVMLANMILDKPESHVHVIEKLAYDELDNRFEIFKENVKWATKTDNDFKIKADKLAGAIDKAMVSEDAFETARILDQALKEYRSGVATDQDEGPGGEK